MAPSVPKKKRKVSLPENEEAAARIFEKHRSMAAQQPGGLPDHQAALHRHAKRKKGKRNKPYVPQLNSAAYAIVITLYRPYHHPRPGPGLAYQICGGVRPRSDEDA
ncbi:hypothetical protein ZWY2020_020431 [Hordeum vulgare]|nr:hypothetical protein ZWY2020_020431 [Hordeum vulgare]